MEKHWGRSFAAERRTLSHKLSHGMARSARGIAFVGK